MAAVVKHLRSMDDALVDFNLRGPGPMMPLDITVKHDNTALHLAAEEKVHEANLALKAAEESTVLDTIAMAETPGAQVNW